MQFNGEAILVTILTTKYCAKILWQKFDRINVKNKLEALVGALSTGLKTPSGNVNRLITHIGSVSGFVVEGLNAFVSKNTGDYHGEMDAEHYEKWFSDILLKIEPGSVIFYG